MSLTREMDRRREQAVKRAVMFERQALRTGVWPAWKTDRENLPTSRGWPGQVHTVYTNGIFCVQVRDVPTAEFGVVLHAAITNCSNTDIAWRDKQRIKDELFGTGLMAIEVFPRTLDLIDGANMYHLWVMPAGYSLPFGIHLPVKTAV